MALKGNWQNLRDGESEVRVKPINDIAAAVIELEDESNSGSSITVDAELSTTSKNPVQNMVITEEFNKLPSIFATKNDLNAFVPRGIYEKDIGGIESALTEQSEEIEGIKDTLEKLPSGSGTVRTELVIDIPVWDGQPTASVADLKSVFKDWETKNYFVTLKGTDGTALPSGQFKLTETIDGYAKAVDCIFTLEGHKLTENYPVDFKEVDGVFKLRDAGVKSVQIPCKLKKATRRTIYYNGKTTSDKSSGSDYIRYWDSSILQYKGVKCYGTLGTQYTGVDGYLLHVSSYLLGGTKIACFRIDDVRTKTGSNGFFIVQATSSQKFGLFFSDVTDYTDNFANEEIEFVKFQGDAHFYSNGSMVTLEETA